jgi:outer membrane protein TolC
LLVSAAPLGAQQLPDSTAEQDVSLAMTPSMLVTIALAANAELATMRREFDAARARVPQAGALPDPMLEFKNLTQSNAVPFLGMSGDFAENMFGASQTVPWFGVRRLRGLVASAEAEAQYQAYEARVREIAAEVRTAAAELYGLDASLRVVARDSAILEKLTTVAEARYGVGDAQQVDVINARLELAELAEQQGMLEMRRAGVVARLNALLYRDPDSVAPAVTLEGQAVDLPDYAELARRADEHSPALRRQRRVIDRASHELRLAERESRYPEVTFAFAYHNRPAFPDYYEYGVTLQLPLWSFNKQRYGIAEKTADQAAALSRLNEITSTLRANLRDAYTRATSAARLMRLAEQGLVPQAALALESAMASYQVGRIDFATVLEALRRALRYETGYYQQRVEYERALADIEALTGVDVGRKP